MVLAADAGCAEAELMVGMNRPVSGDRFWLQFNDRPEGCAVRVFEKGSPEAGGTRPAPAWPWTAVFSIPADRIRSGRNELVLRNETDSIHPLEVLGMRVDLR